VSSDHGNRTFFEGTAALPSQTPPALKKLRAVELAELRGDNLTPEQRAAERRGADRVYDYTIVRDLGNGE
jgi:lipoxygenase/linoleate 9S-lipoxygenase